jgi:hypothetical protein
VFEDPAPFAVNAAVTFIADNQVKISRRVITIDTHAILVLRLPPLIGKLGVDDYAREGFITVRHGLSMSLKVLQQLGDLLRIGKLAFQIGRQA